MWTCPQCGSKVDPGFDVCWSCGTSRDGTKDPGFVSADDFVPSEADAGSSVDDPVSGKLTGDDTSALVPCYQAFSLMEAKFLADQLGEQGITAVSDSQDMQDALGGWSGNPRVYCQEDDLPRARTFLEEYERRKAQHNPLES